MSNQAAQLQLQVQVAQQVESPPMTKEEISSPSLDAFTYIVLGFVLVIWLFVALVRGGGEKGG